MRTLLHTSATNTQVIRLYESIGLTLRGRTKILVTAVPLPARGPAIS